MLATPDQHISPTDPDARSKLRCCGLQCPGRRRGDGLPIYGADARLTLRFLRRPATRARRLPRLRAVVSSASTGCREPSVPARVAGPCAATPDPPRPPHISPLPPPPPLTPPPPS